MTEREQTGADSARRLPILDALRGVAILMMVSFHFCFDLTYWQLANWDLLADPRWIAWRNVIVALFLWLVGAGLVLGQATTAARFWRRWGQVAGSAVLISLVSWFMFAERFIYFGVLHFIAVAQCLGRWGLGVGAGRRPGGILVLACICLLAGNLEFAAMNPRWLNWLGLAASKPLTEDYVPLLPWLGVVLLGMAAVLFWQSARRQVPPITLTDGCGQLSIKKNDGLHGLAWLGRHSLAIYLLHQPLLMGVLVFWVSLRG